MIITESNLEEQLRKEREALFDNFYLNFTLHGIREVCPYHHQNRYVSQGYLFQRMKTLRQHLLEEIRKNPESLTYEKVLQSERIRR